MLARESGRHDDHKVALLLQQQRQGGNAIEAMILYIRNEVILPNVGHHGDGRGR